MHTYFLSWTIISYHGLLASVMVYDLLDLITFQNLVIMHSIDKEYIRVSFFDSFIKNIAVISHDYPLRNAHDYKVPKINYEYLKSVSSLFLSCYME